MRHIAFLALTLLMTQPAAPAQAAEVTGTYERVELDPDYICPGSSAPAIIEVRHTRQGKYRVTGLALWIQDIPEPMPHIGDFDFTGHLVGDTIRLSNKSSYPIDLHLTFKDDRLMVTDAGNTGGINVTFTGNYKRQEGAPLDPSHPPEGITCR